MQSKKANFFASQGRQVSPGLAKVARSSAFLRQGPFADAGLDRYELAMGRERSQNEPEAGGGNERLK
jgi:hypothetical protein